MSLFDDDRPARPAAKPAHEVGQELGRLSEAELADRIALLRAEIVRLEAELAAKSAQRSAAAQLFRS